MPLLLLTAVCVQSLELLKELPLNLTGSGPENIQDKPQKKAVLGHDLCEPCRGQFVMDSIK